MARRIVHQLVDDIDGTVLEVGEGETAAAHRVADIPAVVELLGTLADLRS